MAGFLLVSFYEGVYKFNFSRKLQQNQDASMEKVERAWNQRFHPKIDNKWAGL